MMSLAIVDFPHPDSPTSPKVSPARSSKSTPSTAWTWPTVLRNRIPVVSGKCLTRFRTASKGTASPAVEGTPSAAERESAVTSAIEQLLAVMARALAPGEDLTQRRDVVRALAI